MILLLLTHLTILHLVCSRNPILIVVSYDGFRYNYLQRNITPHMFKLRQESTFAEYMYNVFPTKTFPNHFTIATGLYTEVHGVVGNSFYDPELKKIVNVGEEMFIQNKEVVPIWTLNELAGEGRYSGAMMWPGSPFRYKNKLPTYVEDWSHEYDNFKRVDTIIKWLTDPKKPANLIMLYFEIPDYYSHVYGPDSKEVYEYIRVLDNVTQYLDDQLKMNKLKDIATVIHLSDHGMSGVKYKNAINISQYLEQNTYTLADTSPCIHVIPKEGYENSIYDRLKKASENLGTFDVFRKKDLLERWHFKHNVRVPPIFLLAKEGYGFEDILKSAEHYKSQFHIEITPDTVFGVHGYDTENTNMHPFFMMRGPRIKKNHRISPSSTLNLYNLFAEILKIKPMPNNGTTVLLKELITESNGVMSIILITVGGVALSLLLIGCAAAITVLLIKRQQNMTTAAALNKRFPQTFQQSIEAQHLLDTEEA